VSFHAILLAARLIAQSTTGGGEPGPDESRAEALRRERQAALPIQVGPQRPPGFIEARLLALEKAETPGLFQRNLRGLYPRITTLASGAGLAGGFRYWRPEIGPTPLDVQASAFITWYSYQYYDLQVGRIPHQIDRLPPMALSEDTLPELRRAPPRPGGPLFAYAELRYRDFTREDFFGLGPDTPESDRTNYRLKQSDLDGVVHWQWLPALALIGRAGILQAGIGPGRDGDVASIEEVFDDAGAPGLAAQPDFGFYVATVDLDLRDVPLNPHRGLAAAVSFERYLERGGGDAFDFSRWTFEAAGYVPLFSPQRVLALRGFVSTAEADDGARVPFFLMHTLGGSRSLRGLHGLRYRDAHVLNLQAEYRWEANRWLETALFADYGKAVAERSQLDLDGLHASYGFGVRFKAPSAVVLRFDFAWSEERFQTYVRFGSSF
jgi:hypothetical protein